MPDQMDIGLAHAASMHRLGLNVPYEWWPGAATLKGIEAAGFRWVQVAAPPVEMLADPRHGVRHATALRRSLEVTDAATSSCTAPPTCSSAAALHDRAFEGLLEYAHHIGAAPRRLPRARLRPARHRSRRRRSSAAPALAARPRRSACTVCLENLCPVYPGPVERLPRPAVGPRPRAPARQPRRTGCCSTSATRNVVAGFMGVETRDPRRAGARRRAPVPRARQPRRAARGGEGGPSVDPLQLDLHLPPGGGTIPWDQLSPALLAHDAPLMMEIHPAHRPAPSALREAAVTASDRAARLLRARSKPGALGWRRISFRTRRARSVTCAPRRFG